MNEIFNTIIQQTFDESRRVHDEIHKKLTKNIITAAEIIAAALANQNKVLICGNGGSAADAQHWTAELIGRFEKRERRALPVIALSANTSTMTAWSNDYSYETVFSRQVEGLGQEGDVIIVITTSGNSPNCLEAVKAAHTQKCKTIALLGKDGGKLRGVCSHEIIVPARRTPRVQEGHQIIYHLICELVEVILFDS